MKTTSIEKLRALGVLAPEREPPVHAQFTLPWPPSANNLKAIFTPRGGRARLITTADGRKYHRDVQAVVLASGFRERDKFRWPDRLACIIEAHVPNNLRRDLANLEKAAMDGLKKAGVFDDDSQIDDLRIIRCGVVPGGKLVVKVSRLGGARQESFL